MLRDGLWSVVTVKDDERAFLSRDGTFVRLLGPGRTTEFDPRRRLECEVVKIVRTEIAAERALLFEKTQPEIAETNFEIVQAAPTRLPSFPSMASPGTWCCPTPRARSGRR